MSATSSRRTVEVKLIQCLILHPPLHGAADFTTSLLSKRKLPVIEPGARQQHRAVGDVLVAAHLSHEVVIGTYGQDD